MSIIHDALKKAEEAKTAQKDGEKTDSKIPSFQPPPASPKKKLNPKIVIIPTLLVVLMLGTYMFGKKYMKGFFTSGPSQSSKGNVVKITPANPDSKQLAPKQITTPTQKNNAEEDKFAKANRLKDDFFSFYEKGNLKQALLVLEEMIPLLPTEPEIYNNYGVVLSQLDRKKEAMEAYHKALALNPNHAEALNNLGAMYLEKRHYAKSKELLKRALDVDKDYLEPYLHLAIAYEKNDELEKAKQFYRDFLKRSEGRVERRVRLQVEEKLAGLMEL